MFVTQYNWEHEPGEENSGISMVDSSGYISAKERIENLIRAGERLDEYRREMYDLDHGDDDDGEWMDPMREQGLDYADVHRIRQETLRRMATQQAMNKAEREQGIKSNLSEAKSLADEASEKSSDAKAQSAEF